MKYRLTFRSNQPVVLPTQYQKILQAAILTWVGRGTDYGTFLHDQGYQSSKRVFKLYTFSKLFGRHRYDAHRHRLVFDDTIQLYLSFFTPESHSYILNLIAQEQALQLGEAKLQLQDCELVQEQYQDCVVETLSPITIHSTFALADGRKKTYYYAPWERDFSDMIRQNLIRKWDAFADSEEDAFLRNDDFVIKSVGRVNPSTVFYSGFQIKGWNGTFRLSGSPQLIRMALLAGLGARNSIGLGCVLQKYCR